MKIFINVDKNKELAVSTKERLTDTCNELNITVCEKASEADVICSIGGDGTFLESSRISKGCPIIGINCGTLGYLTDVNPDDIQKAMKDLLDNKFYIENRMMLEGEIIKENGEEINQLAKDYYEFIEASSDDEESEEKEEIENS